MNRREPSGNMVTPETVDLLRKQGANSDLIAYADRHAVRYSSRDMDHARWTGLAIGCTFSALAFIALAFVVFMAIGPYSLGGTP